MITLCLILVGLIQMSVSYFDLPLWMEAICQLIGMILISISAATETSITDRIKELEKRVNNNDNKGT